MDHSKGGGSHELYTLEPRVLTFRPDNTVDQRLSYQVFESEARQFDFRILQHGVGISD